MDNHHRETQGDHHIKEQSGYAENKNKPECCQAIQKNGVRKIYVSQITRQPHPYQKNDKAKKKPATEQAH
jgi:hypothetical protein